MKDTVFREYDIRGYVGKEFILDQVYPLAQAIAYYIHKNSTKKTKKVIIGMDGRTDSPFITKQVCQAFIDSGFDIIFIGLCPSPVLYFALHTLSADAGCMITASHNPKEYNGIKIMLGTDSVWGTQIKEIETLYKEKKRVISEHTGSITNSDMVHIYVDWLSNHFSHLKKMDIPTIFDCGNAVAAIAIIPLIAKMEWENRTQLLCTEVDGTFPGHVADPTVEENMADVKELVLKTRAAIGIGFDGDGDRMAAMTHEGDLITGDKLLAIFVQSVLKHYPQASVVFNVTSSSGLIHLFQQWNVKSYMVPTGHAIMKTKMNETGALLGAETSCHFFFHDRYFGYDDGIYAALRLLEIMHNTGKSLHDLVAIFPHKELSREYRLACDDEKKQSVVQAIKTKLETRSDVQLITVDGVRATTPYGWGIVRASNTQPVLSVRFESDTKDGLVRIRQDFITLLTPYLDESILRQLHT